MAPGAPENESGKLLGHAQLAHHAHADEAHAAAPLGIALVKVLWEGGHTSGYEGSFSPAVPLTRCGQAGRTHMARSTGKRADVPPSVGGGLCRQCSIGKGTTLLVLNNHQYRAEPSCRTVGSVHCRCRRRDRVRRRGSRAGGCRPWLRAIAFVRYSPLWQTLPLPVYHFLCLSGASRSAF